MQDRAQGFVGHADKVFPGVTAADAGKAIRQIWPKYEWSMGSYARYRPGQYQRSCRALANPHGSLSFAGEHAVDESGFMNAAAESGERAATHLLALLGRAHRHAA